jgi:nitrite reductase (NO-forming)
MRPGLYLYHCVAAPAGLHIANGMYGLILVEPAEGLPKVDREYFIVQGEFYTEGKFGERGPQHFSMDKALAERPEYVVFNGQVGSLMGDNALKAKAGERVRIYLGNAGPSLVSSFHVVGEIFDDVYGEGGTVANQHNVQTTVVPVGGSAMVEFEVDVPGEYQLVDHSMFRAFNRGAMGLMKVEGKPNELIFSGKTSEEPYQPGTHLVQLAKFSSPVGSGTPLTTAEMLDQGARVYSGVCVACHQADGKGVPNAFPPLAKSDFLMADTERAIKILLNGLKGEITVNGSKYNAEMPKPPINEQEIASVLTYVRNNFGNSGDPVTLADVRNVQNGAGGIGTDPTKKAAVDPKKEAISRVDED